MIISNDNASSRAEGGTDEASARDIQLEACSSLYASLKTKDFSEAKKSLERKTVKQVQAIVGFVLENERLPRLGPRSVRSHDAQQLAGDRSRLEAHLAKCWNNIGTAKGTTRWRVSWNTYLSLSPLLKSAISNRTSDHADPNKFNHCRVRQVIQCGLCGQKRGIYMHRMDENVLTRTIIDSIGNWLSSGHVNGFECNLSNRLIKPNGTTSEEVPYMRTIHCFQTEPGLENREPRPLRASKKGCCLKCRRADLDTSDMLQINGLVLPVCQECVVIS
jgi:hypothetical protein